MNLDLVIYNMLNSVPICILKCRRKAIIDRDLIDLPSWLIRILKLTQVLLQTFRPRQQL